MRYGHCTDGEYMVDHNQGVHEQCALGQPISEMVQVDSEARSVLLA